MDPQQVGNNHNKCWSFRFCSLFLYLAVSGQVRAVTMSVACRQAQEWCSVASGLTPGPGDHPHCSLLLPVCDGPIATAVTTFLLLTSVLWGRQDL